MTEFPRGMAAMLIAGLQLLRQQAPTRLRSRAGKSAQAKLR